MKKCWSGRVLLYRAGVAAVSFCVLFLMAGCGTLEKVDKATVIETLNKNMEIVESVQTSITLFLEGQYYDFNSKGEPITDGTPHRASADSKIDIYASFKPLGFRSEAFSNITIDGFTTSEARYGYTVKNDSQYIDYESVNNEEEWSKTEVTRKDELALPKRTGLLSEWDEFVSGLEHVDTVENGDGPPVIVFTGRVYSAVLQEIFDNRVFNDFVSNIEWVINETIPCTLYLDGDTYLPQSFELSLADEFVTHDVNFSEAKVTVSYSNWDQVGNITVPKKVSVLAEDRSAALYSNFTARDLFIPYEPKPGQNNQGSGNAAPAVPAGE